MNVKFVKENDRRMNVKFVKEMIGSKQWQAEMDRKKKISPKKNLIF
jgi:hypothetical protein